MIRRARVLGLTVTSALVAACADTAPLTPAGDVSPAFSAPVFSASAAGGPAYATVDGIEAPHAVYFKPGRGSTVSAQAIADGATVNYINDRFGFAMVTGLSENGVTALRAANGVTEVALDEMVDMGLPASELAAEAASVIASPANPATANFFPRQWHLQAINAPAAWAAGKLGSPSVTVAVLDGGIGYTHADLAGLVDLPRSASFLPIEDGFLQFQFPGAHPIADLQFHGTHVAATIASNALAAAGVSSKTTLMGVKVCYGVTLQNSSTGAIVTRAGSCVGTAILAGILHAVDNGADIINMSLGGAFLKRGSQGFNSTINRIFNYANQNNVLVVVAAGNDGSDLDRHELPDADGNPVRYPSLFKSYCDAPHVVCVSATGPTAGPTNGPWQNIDALAGYSNFGRSAITVAAPGGNFRSVTAACTPFSLAAPICQTGTFVLGLSGTSMATPHVSGLAALIAAEGVTNASQLRARLVQGADDLGQRGTDPFYGRGRINVQRSLGL